MSKLMHIKKAYKILSLTHGAVLSERSENRSHHSHLTIPQLWASSITMKAIFVIEQPHGIEAISSACQLCLQLLWWPMFSRTFMKNSSTVPGINLSCKMVYCMISAHNSSKTYCFISIPKIFRQYCFSSPLSP